jgi:ribosomal protein S18 acetylase RimI-like enzyme
MIQFLEELSLNAYPALNTVHYDGWLLRFADGYTRRVNSVQLLYPSTLPLDEKIANCESLYTSRGLRTVFKLTGAHHPPDFEEALIAHGYDYDCLTQVQTASLDHVPDPGGTAWAALDGFLTPVWLEDFARLRALNDVDREIFTRLQMNIMPKAGYARLLVDGETAAVAMGVVERGWLGVFDVMTAAHLRRRGYARQVMLHLLHWGLAQGARHAYLQVMADNTPALGLYAGLGFTRTYDYWYRQKTPSNW